ncbi:MAG TPA: MCP four helix bundle domain-containing protein, partial [Prolixibacteraceae bacterium]|nr:MCP four helix bundle domain-containing protein [Prolixibacteraceae bacterium]
MNEKKSNPLNFLNGSKWNDLKIGTKIGLGFGMLIFLGALIGGIATFSMIKIQDETNYLANESLPSVNESFRIDKDWREVLFFLQQYDYIRDPYYLNRADQYLNKYTNSLDALIKIADNSKKSTIARDKLTTLKTSLVSY